MGCVHHIVRSVTNILHKCDTIFVCIGEGHSYIAQVHKTLYYAYLPSLLCI